MKVIFHIGTGKTGTSSIQNFLYKNKEALAALRVIYPELGMTKIDHFGQEIAAHYGLVPMVKNRDVALAAKLSALFKASPDGVVVFSCENFYHHFDAHDIQYLFECIGAVEVKVLVYVRRQDKYVESAWKQQVKVGDARIPFHMFLERHKAKDALPDSHANYYQRLQAWANVFGDSAIAVRVFDRLAFVDGDLTADFLQAIGVSTDGEMPWLIPATSDNEALPSELIYLLRHINWRRMVKPAQQAGLVAFLREKYSFDDPALLTWADRKAMMDNYRETNELLFSRFCGAGVPQAFEVAEQPSAADRDEEQHLPRADDIALRCLVQAWEGEQMSLSTTVPKRSFTQLSDSGDGPTSHQPERSSGGNIPELRCERISAWLRLLPAWLHWH